MKLASKLTNGQPDRAEDILIVLSEIQHQMEWHRDLIKARIAQDTF